MRCTVRAKIMSTSTQLAINNFVKPCCFNYYCFCNICGNFNFVFLGDFECSWFLLLKENFYRRACVCSYGIGCAPCELTKCFTNCIMFSGTFSQNTPGNAVIISVLNIFKEIEFLGIALVLLSTPKCPYKWYSIDSSSWETWKALPQCQNTEGIRIRLRRKNISRRVKTCLFKLKTYCKIVDSKVCSMSVYCRCVQYVSHPCDPDYFIKITMARRDTNTVCLTAHPYSTCDDTRS